MYFFVFHKYVEHNVYLHALYFFPCTINFLQVFKFTVITTNGYIEQKYPALQQFLEPGFTAHYTV